jgi:Spy/CpxP family protein refolding chaperone
MLVAGFIAICVLVAYVTAHFVVNQQSAEPHQEPYGHHWLHEELALTPSEVATIEAFEADYRTQKEALLVQFKIKVAELGALLQVQSDVSPEVEHAIHELHIVHGDLQELSIRHYFQMLSVLPPEKQAKLRRLAGEALSVPE